MFSIDEDGDTDNLSPASQSTPVKSGNHAGGSPDATSLSGAAVATPRSRHSSVSSITSDSSYLQQVSAKPGEFSHILIFRCHFC